MTSSEGVYSVRGAACAPDGSGHCITCADEAVEVCVLAIDEATSLACVAVAGVEAEIDVSLVNDVAPGDKLLVHAGAALAKL